MYGSWARSASIAAWYSGLCFRGAAVSPSSRATSSEMYFERLLSCFAASTFALRTRASSRLIVTFRISRSS